MRELLTSLLRLSWATCLFGIRQMTGIVAGGGRVAESFTKVAAAAAEEIKGGGFQEDFREAFPAVSEDSPAPRKVAPSSKPFDSGSLNVTRFVVLGEGLAAGMGDFSLASDRQAFSFPAQLAHQMRTAFPQRLIEPPGIGNAPGFAALPVIIPSPLQTTVVDRIPPDRPFDLSIPGYTVHDSIHRRVTLPLIDKEDDKQTLANFILGLLDVAYGNTGALPTQLESALSLEPTFAIVALGFSEALEAALKLSARDLPSLPVFRKDYETIIGRLRGTGADVLALTIPDPFHTAHFADLNQAAEIIRVRPECLVEFWGLREDDNVAVPGLHEIAFQIFSHRIAELPSHCIVPSEFPVQLADRLREINQAIRDIAESHGAVVYDLHECFQRLPESHVQVNRRNLTNRYLGGFYSLNGYYPGATGHALIANEILDTLNGHFGASFPSIEVQAIAAADPVANYKPAGGACWTANALRQMSGAGISAPRGFPLAAPKPRGPTRTRPLRLPPGLEQVLPLNESLSYFGDGIGALNCTTPQTIQYGTGGNLLFGGLAMVDSHLSGKIRIKFSPPVQSLTHFQVFFEGGFTGSDETLEAPRLFKMAFRNNRVDEVPGFTSSGTLNLETGDVDTSSGALNIYAQYSSTALNALVGVNPNFPKPPQSPLSFPGPYGSACATFEQRADGLLDFTFVGTTFVPLGNGTVWPLNFTGPDFDFATIPASGTVMHPHLALSTRTSEAEEESTGLELPVNTIREYTLFAPISSFGDIFTLEAPQLGGPGTGRSRLLGRVQIQFGPRCGDSIPIAVSTTTAGGTLAPMDPSPIAQLFPGRLTPGPLGFYESLRFPLRTYSLNDLAIIDDPFDVAVGALDLRSGKALHPLLHRGFINQDLIFALLRVEPRTPQNSFFFRGAAGLTQNHGGAPRYQFYGQVHIPYPAGFAFPDANFATGFPIGGASALDPYLWLCGLPDKDVGDIVATGQGDALSSRFEKFTYRYEIPSQPCRKAIFEYENVSQGGKFRMHSLIWVGFADFHGGSPGSRTYDTLSFTGFGVWSKDGVERVELASVQVCNSPTVSYIGIQVGLGDISNANTPVPASLFPLRAPEPGGHECCVGSPTITKQAQPSNH